VLPFDNLGDSADAYFADGVTDAVRGKLAEISGLEVIARNSSLEYRGATKPQEQIASELRVDYLLTGTVRWVKQADGTSRVQVRPELVEIGDGVARTRWGQPFNAPLTDVFEVQEQIAGQVSGALDVALGTSDRQRLAERPTQDLAAYDLYLQAQAISGTDPVSLRRSIGLLERALARDSTFGIAWSRLAGLRTLLWARTIIKPSESELARAMERAMALAPSAPETYRARISYASNVTRDFAMAKEIATEAVTRYPGDPDLVRQLGFALVQLGEEEAGLTALRRAAALDPRNSRTLRLLGGVLVRGGEVAEGRVMLQRTLELAPDDLTTTQLLVLTWLREGDLAGARRALNGASPPGGRAELLGHVSMFGDLYWVPDRAQQDTVLTLSAEHFDNDPGSRALVFAQILHDRGDFAGAARWADTARRGLEALGPRFADPQIIGLIGLAYAYQRRHADARPWLERGVAESRASGDAAKRSYTLELMARGMVLAGRNDEAIAALEEAVTPVEGPTRGLVGVDAHYAPLHGEPRFQRLVAGDGRATAAPPK
jgi:TolB-like protein